MGKRIDGLFRIRLISYWTRRGFEGIFRVSLTHLSHSNIGALPLCKSLYSDNPTVPKQDLIDLAPPILFTLIHFTVN